jgi:starch synthase (maltosyl-transferring)
VHDELTGQTWRWGQKAFVRLTHDDPAHILTLIRYGSRSTASGSPSSQGSDGAGLGVEE